MVKRCIIPNCTSSYRRYLQKVSLFKAPKDEHRRQLWQQKIPRSDFILTSKHLICEKHFQDHFIIREWNIIDKNGEKIKRRQPMLSKEAFPTLFPGCPIYKVNKPRQRTRKIQQTETNKSKKVLQVAATESESIVQSDMKTENIGECDERKIENGQGAEECYSPVWMKAGDTFGSLWANRHLIKLPSISWAVHAFQEDKVECIVFSEIGISEKGAGVIKKQLICDAEHGVRAYVLSKRFYLSLFNWGITEFCVARVEETLQSFHLISICMGVPRYECTMLEENLPKFGYVSSLGSWHHNRCTLITKNQRRCYWCDKFAKHTSRKTETATKS